MSPITFRCFARRGLLAGLFATGSFCPRPAAGQGTPLFVLDLAGTPVGEIPVGIKQLQGILEVVIKDGAPMLKASARSEFLITLPRVLPQAFTLEFDLVPKACCSPQDLSFEGTPTINQGGSSAHVMWDSDGSLQIVGGGPTYDTPMPEDFRTTLPGVLTNVVVTLDGSGIQLYTNGRRMYTLDRQFARGRVLRVFLGGQDGGDQAVHLAGLRITGGAAPLGTIAANPPPPPGQPAAPPAPASPPAPTSAPAPAQGANPAVGAPSVPVSGSSALVPRGPVNLTVAARQGWGSIVEWSEVLGAVGYEIERRLPGASFGRLGGIVSAQSVAAGMQSAEDVTVLPGIRYEYQVRAVFPTGPVSSHSPIAAFNASSHIPQVSNLGLSQIHAPVQGKSLLRWDWTPIPTALTYEIELEVQESSPPHASLWKSQLSVFAIDAPPFYAHADAGKRVRLCVSLVRAVSSTHPLPHAVCKTEDLP